MQCKLKHYSAVQKRLAAVRFRVGDRATLWCCFSVQSEFLPGVKLTYALYVVKCTCVIFNFKIVYYTFKPLDKEFLDSEQPCFSKPSQLIYNYRKEPLDV